VLRKPQLLAAEAQVISADSALEKSKLELERSSIVAPYAGRVMEKMVDVGQVVNNSSKLAEVYAIDYVEIRLPLRNRDLSFIDLPEEYRIKNEESREDPEVTIYSELAGGSQWHGKVVRTESAIDDRARQLHVVAQVDDPFGHQVLGKTPLKMGQYVTAELSGKNVHGALVIPNSAIYQGSYVYIVVDGLLHRREISIAWQNQQDAIIDDGLIESDVLVLTSLGQVTSGVRVSISNRAGEVGRTAELNSTSTKAMGSM
jgi:multidrug efflux system membrane fusion protein